MQQPDEFNLDTLQSESSEEEVPECQSNESTFDFLLAHLLRISSRKPSKNRKCNDLKGKYYIDLRPSTFQSLESLLGQKNTELQDLMLLRLLHLNLIEMTFLTGIEEYIDILKDNQVMTSVNRKNTLLLNTNSRSAL